MMKELTRVYPLSPAKFRQMDKNVPKFTYIVTLTLVGVQIDGPVDTNFADILILPARF